MRKMVKDKSERLKNYVSNLDSNVYTISKLPEEMIAVVFAYVSRSPKSFRDNLLSVTEEKASKFHEKWVLDYGHASVSELAVVHLGIEKVSRLFSSIFERANLFYSPIEYSQRYQKPKRFDYYVPEILKQKKYSVLLDKYREFHDLSYDIYEQLNDKLFVYLKNKYSKKKETELQKIAFEDARYSLTLSVFTNLGLTSNARAIENALSVLLSSEYDEVKYIAKKIKSEVRAELPTLVKYADENPYLKDLKRKIEDYSETGVSQTSKNTDEEECIKLLDYTGKYNQYCRRCVLEKIIRNIMYSEQQVNHLVIDRVLKDMSEKQLVVLYYNLFSQIGTHDNPHNALEEIRYSFELLISEANWHQLLRHRKANFMVQHPSVKNGITVPPNVKEAGCEELLFKAANESEKLFDIFQNEGLTNVSHYVVINAHRRRVVLHVSLWEMYHIINLRLSPHAQWDIKDTVMEMVERIKKVHPDILEPAIQRVQKRFN